MKKGYIDMKKAEEYLKQLFQEPYNLEEGSIEYDFLQVIKEVQRDAIKETCQACADNADADVTLLGWLEENKEEYNLQAGQDYEVYVIKSSILEVADKLIKELE